MKINHPTPTTISFKCSSVMLDSINEIMCKRYLDRSSVLRLAVYLLDGFMKRPDMLDIDLHELVDKLEHEHAQEFISFSDFCGY